MTAWWQQPFNSFDFESTGVNPRADRIVTATLLRVDPVNRTRTAQEWLADPGVEIPAGATKVHGVSTEQAREQGRPANEVVAEIFEALQKVFASGEALAIYNAPYDLVMLGCEMLRHHGEKTIYVPECVVDGLVIDKRINKFVRGQGARKLVNTCRRNGIVLSEEDAHTSLGDTYAHARLVHTQARTSRLIGALDLATLHERQAGWFEQQNLEFADYLARKGDEEGAARCRAEAGSWPMHELRLEEMAPPEPAAVSESDGEPPF